MFAATLFVKSKSWKQLKCPLTGAWINNRILLSNKEEETANSGYNMDGCQKHYYA